MRTLTLWHTVLDLTLHRSTSSSGAKHVEWASRFDLEDETALCFNVEGPDVLSWHAKPLRPHDAHGLPSRHTVNITTMTVYERVQSPLTVASDLVLPIVRGGE